MIGPLTRAIRWFFIGPRQHFVFGRSQHEELIRPDHAVGLYIHIPFCRNMCPYCPYNKIEYESALVAPYVNALLSEVDLLSCQLGGLEVDSIYIGGGTPTTVIDELGPVLEHVRQRFRVTGPTCIETSPTDVHPDTLSKLEECGVGLISLGVQSFDDRSLRLIGRNYDSKAVLAATDEVMSRSFESVNIDLMFALPGQSTSDVIADLQKAERTGANQITTYPLFTFPYSSVGRYKKLKKVKMPSLDVRRTMYSNIYDHLVDNGFRRVSVWSFNRTDAPRYSSVTRNDYIGLGASAGSHIPGIYYLNTFSPKAYIDSCLGGSLPRALEMEFTPSMEKYYWLYWRFYDTYIPNRQIKDMFGQRNAKVAMLLWTMRILRLVEENEEVVSLTKRGAFWVHLMQNYFSLSYVNKVWTRAKREPWPDQIRI